MALQNCTVDTGDTAWVTSATVLVLGMVPGLALFEAGLLRGKSALSVYSQVVSGVLLMSVMWNVFGFSVTYGPSQKGIIGYPLAYPFFLNLREGECFVQASTIPGYSFAVFQMMFAAITPLLQTGSFAERMKFSVFLVYIVLWETIVYYPIAHWIWGSGWLSPTGPVFNRYGVIDFAGGITIHVSSGVSALVACIMIGRRKGFTKHKGYYRPSNLTTALVGVVFLWIGWFGFNAGSALTSSALAANAVMNTQMASAVSGLVWLVLCRIHHGKVSLVEVLNGTIAGLAGITPASGFIDPEWAFFVSVVLGFSSFYGVIILKSKLKIDDALDVSVVHGLTGLIGSLANGFFASKAVNAGGQDGWIAGRPIQIAFQLLGIGVTLVWSAWWTFVILKVLDKLCGIRVSAEVEISGIGLEEHGEFLDDTAFFIHKKAVHHEDWAQVTDSINSELPHPDPDIIFAS